MHVTKLLLTSAELNELAKAADSRAKTVSVSKAALAKLVIERTRFVNRLADLGEKIETE